MPLLPISSLLFVFCLPLYSFYGFCGDVLSGGTGKDTLTGGDGRDEFVFDVAPSKANEDIITDFDSSEGDDIVLVTSATRFSTLMTANGYGRLDESFFTANDKGKAMDRDDYIIYNTRTGALLYDADGDGRAAAVQFATLKNKADLGASDIFCTLDD